MKTVGECVRELTAGVPFIEEGLEEGLINISALARKLQPDVNKRMGREIQEGAIIMAIQRRTPAPYQKVRDRLKKFFKSLGDITVRSDLGEFSYQNSKTLLERHAEFLKEASAEGEFFCTFSQGVYESTIIVSYSKAALLQKLLKREKLLGSQLQLASVTLRLPESNVRIAGIYYFILHRLAREGINIVEVISTQQEFTLVVKETDTDRTFSLLMKLKKNIDAF